MFSLQLEASPICHLALEKSIAYLKEGDALQSCTFILLPGTVKLVILSFLMLVKRLLLKFRNFWSFAKFALLFFIYG